VERVGEGVEVIAELDDRPVAVEQRTLVAATFHPELARDGRLHRRMLQKVEEA